MTSRWLSRALAILLLALLFLSSPGLEAQKEGVRHAGDVFVVAIPVAALSATWVLHDREGAHQFLKAFLTNTAATEALKLVISRERPDASDDHSFPSGHTSTSFQGASFIHIRYGLLKGLSAYAAATFVGFSRVYSDKHYVSDVLAGAALGTLSSYLFTDRFKGVEVIPGAEMGRYGVEIRMRFGSPPRAR